MDANLSYEIKAEAFRIMTGYTAPGKSASPESNASEDERWEAWRNWCGQHSDIISAVMLAVERNI